MGSRARSERESRIGRRITCRRAPLVNRRRTPRDSAGRGNADIEALREDPASSPELQIRKAREAFVRKQNDQHYQGGATGNDDRTGGARTKPSDKKLIRTHEPRTFCSIQVVTV